MNMPFEVFNPPPKGRKRRTPSAVYTKYGTLSFNAAALELIDTGRVRLAGDRGTGQIRVEPSSDWDAFQISKSGQVSARRFAEHFAIDVGARWDLELIDGALIGTPVSDKNY